MTVTHAFFFLKTILMIPTPEQKRDSAQVSATKVIAEINSFIDRHEVKLNSLATSIGISGQALGRLLNHTPNPGIVSIFLIIQGLETITGAKFEMPSFVRERPVYNAK